jgi:hypothetical protein
MRKDAACRFIPQRNESVNSFDGVSKPGNMIEASSSRDCGSAMRQYLREYWFASSRDERNRGGGTLDFVNELF